MQRSCLNEKLSVNEEVKELHQLAGPSFRGNLLSRLPRPCLCVFCRDRAGNLTPHKLRLNSE
jgi:hypothetical protein